MSARRRKKNSEFSKEQLQRFMESMPIKPEAATEYRFTAPTSGTSELHIGSNIAVALMDSAKNNVRNHP